MAWALILPFSALEDRDLCQSLINKCNFSASADGRLSVRNFSPVILNSHIVCASNGVSVHPSYYIITLFYILSNPSKIVMFSMPKNMPFCVYPSANLNYIFADKTSNGFLLSKQSLQIYLPIFMWLRYIIFICIYLTLSLSIWWISKLTLKISLKQYQCKKH